MCFLWRRAARPTDIGRHKSQRSEQPNPRTGPLRPLPPTTAAMSGWEDQDLNSDDLLHMLAEGEPLLGADGSSASASDHMQSDSIAGDDNSVPGANALVPAAAHEGGAAQLQPLQAAPAGDEHRSLTTAPYAAWAGSVRPRRLFTRGALALSLRFGVRILARSGLRIGLRFGLGPPDCPGGRPRVPHGARLASAATPRWAAKHALSAPPSVSGTASTPGRAASWRR